MRWRRVVLVGFMASGKTTVGAALARRLGWRLIDIDAELVAREGRSVQEIFAAEGEAAFRGLEARAVRDALDEREVVVVPGGGWAAAAEGRIHALPADTFTVWLRVSAEAAVARARASSVVRPLLAGTDPMTTASALLAEREPFYAPARLHLEAEEKSPDHLAVNIASQMQSSLPRS
ncbi:shikimate kinase [Gaopeijia maritima]|uniref:Shikimate kinase n=1 Tax=Gaopeijia maritima TaxID=3119007 RepID=A0ABU9EDP9_9BACT